MQSMKMNICKVTFKRKELQLPIRGGIRPYDLSFGGGRDTSPEQKKTFHEF
jgi:hypothetical protein